MTRKGSFLLGFGVEGKIKLLFLNSQFSLFVSQLRTVMGNQL